MDENVSYGLAVTLKEAGHSVIAIAESPTSGIIDEDIFNFVVENSTVLITGGIIHIRRGNLTFAKKIALIQRSVSSILISERLS